MDGIFSTNEQTGWMDGERTDDEEDRQAYGQNIMNRWTKNNESSEV